LLLRQHRRKDTRNYQNPRLEDKAALETARKCPSVRTGGFVLNTVSYLEIAKGTVVKERLEAQDPCC
jgi:hypothetical protein